MTTLSQTGALFKPSSAYLPQELLGKVTLGFFYSFFPRSHWETNTDIALGVVFSSGRCFSLPGIAYIVILCFTSAPRPLPASGIAWIGSSPLFFLQEGFDALDPFVPIPVPNYSPREFESCYQYYLQRKWLQNEKGLYLLGTPHRDPAQHGDPARGRLTPRCPLPVPGVPGGGSAGARAPNAPCVPQRTRRPARRSCGS